MYDNFSAAVIEENSDEAKSIGLPDQVQERLQSIYAGGVQAPGWDSTGWTLGSARAALLGRASTSDCSLVVMLRVCTLGRPILRQQRSARRVPDPQTCLSDVT